MAREGREGGGDLRFGAGVELYLNMVHDEDFELTMFTVRQLVPIARVQRKNIKTQTLTAQAGRRRCAVCHIPREPSQTTQFLLSRLGGNRVPRHPRRPARSLG